MADAAAPVRKKRKRASEEHKRDTGPPTLLKTIKCWIVMNKNYDEHPSYNKTFFIKEVAEKYARAITKARRGAVYDIVNTLLVLPDTEFDPTLCEDTTTGGSCARAYKGKLE